MNERTNRTYVFAWAIAIPSSIRRRKSRLFVVFRRCLFDCPMIFDGVYGDGGDGDDAKGRERRNRERDDDLDAMNVISAKRERVGNPFPVANSPVISE